MYLGLLNMIGEVTFSGVPASIPKSVSAATPQLALFPLLGPDHWAPLFFFRLENRIRDGPLLP